MGTVGATRQQEDSAWDRPQRVIQRNLYLLHENNHKSSFVAHSRVVNVINHERWDDLGEGQTVLQDSLMGAGVQGKEDHPIPKDGIGEEMFPGC